MGALSSPNTRGQTHHALVADRSDLGRVAVCHGVHQGADASLDEIDKSDGLVRTVERLPVLQRNTLKMRAKPLVIFGRQQSEQPVGMRFRSLAASDTALLLRHARRLHGCCADWRPIALFTPAPALWRQLADLHGLRDVAPSW